MSKHLLYCKDLLNRTLTRSLLFVLTQLDSLSYCSNPSDLTR